MMLRTRKALEIVKKCEKSDFAPHIGAER